MKKLWILLLLSISCLAQVSQVGHGGTGQSTTANHDILVGTGPSTYTLVTLPDCQDTAGNHLNYTQSGHSVTCGTSGGSSGAVNAIHPIPFSIGDPNGATLITGATDYITVPFDCTLQAYNLLVDTGTVTVKYWKIASGTAIPTSSNSISTSGVGILTGTAIHSVTLTDFTTTVVTQNDIMAMTVTASSGAHYVSSTLQCLVTSTSGAIGFSLGDPNGSVLTTGITSYITFPPACTIQAYNLLIDAGTITVKFWKIASGTAIPTSSNSINTSGVGVSSGTAIHSTTLSDFTTTAVTANDILAMSITAVSGVHYINGVLQCQ